MRGIIAITVRDVQATAISFYFCKKDQSPINFINSDEKWDSIYDICLHQILLQ